MTTLAAVDRPLDVVLAITELAPGFEEDAGLALRYFGGRTLPELGFELVYLGEWDAGERARIDGAIAAAMQDEGLNNVLAQYFPAGPVAATFAGSRSAPAPRQTVDQRALEAIVRRLAADPSPVLCLLLPRDVVLRHGDATSEQGLAGLHGSVHVRRAGRRRQTVYYAAAVYSEGGNGIVAFAEPWKDVCATLYHELQEIRTDPDVGDVIRAGATPEAQRLLGWYSPRGGEIADVPIAAAHGRLTRIMREVPLADGSGTVPVQLLWSNAAGGPEGPISRPHPPSGGPK